MNIRRAVFIAVVVVAAAALAVPLIGLSTQASSARTSARVAAPVANPTPAPEPAASQQWARPTAEGEAIFLGGPPQTETQGRISPETLAALGIPKSKNPAAAAERIKKRLAGGGSGDPTIQSGQPQVLKANSALSAALMTNIGGRDNQFDEVTLIADWDGREDCAADREAKVDDFSTRFPNTVPEIDAVLTRTAISEHTRANGFNENVYYYGDSVGNVWVGVDNAGGPLVDTVLQINLPTVLPTLGLVPISTDDQITITGLAVNPVADLSGEGGVFAGVTGEVLYVSFFDSESGLTLVSSNNTPIRSGVLAILIADAVSPAPDIHVFSPSGFPVTVSNTRTVALSVFSNVAGVAVDDDGSVYFQQVDLIQFTGANITKVRSLDTPTAQDRICIALNVNPIVLATLSPSNGVYGNVGSAPFINRFTNYSGTSTTFGNIVAISTGGCNTLYAAVSRSFVATDDQATQVTEGLFANPSALGATPSMVISFADCSGWFDVCSGLATLGQSTTNVGSTLPAANDIADVVQAGLTLTAGVNNFRVFVQGNGPTIANTNPVVGLAAGAVALKVDMQIDYQVHAGIAVSEEGTVFVISGGAPGGPGKNPSPMVSEVLCFPDNCPADRRADFIDLRGDAFPNPPASGGNTGDGDSDRFDHIFFQAPIDQVTLTPAGLSGLSRGFLRYTNRLAPTPLAVNAPLGFTGGAAGQVLGDDAFACINFETLDPGHQVAGGDDQNPPFRGDDDNGAGSPTLTGPLSGGFEFVFGGTASAATCVWNGFCWNSNGNITFGTGDTSDAPSVPAFRSGPPRIAPAWADLNPASRAQGFLGTFPVMALGFANVNAFKIRWINVPEFGNEACVGSATTATGANIGGGTTNTFSITLYDDGTGVDENASQPLNPANPIGNNSVPFDLQEGPTDLLFRREPNTGVLVGCSPRPEGSGFFVFDYCRMDLLGTAGRPVLVGYSIGGLNPLNPPGLCEINLSRSAAAADLNPFAVLPEANNQTANICSNCCIGEGTEPTLFELFNEGRDAGIGSGGEITFALPDFDLRFEGNDAALCTSVRQRDANRGRVCFFGIGCNVPANPLCSTVVAGSFVVPTPPTGFPASSGLINALCAVQLNAVGCGFFPNEVTTICQGFEEQTGVPLQRPGKTVTTAATLTCDFNGDTVPEATIALTGVTPVNCNLVRGTLSPLTSLPGTAFPQACCGGSGVLTITTTFSAGDNNKFGAFTRTSACSVTLGTRAPLVFSVTPSGGDCSLPVQDLIVTGACFCTPAGAFAVTSVLFEDVANPANRIVVGLNPSSAGQIKNLGSCNLFDVEVNFTSANAGKTFLVYVVGPGGTSRNMRTLPAGAPTGCPIGNEQGIQVTFKCNAPGTPPPQQTPDLAVLTRCALGRDDSGAFFLDVFGSNIKQNASVTVNGQAPKKVKFVTVDPSNANAFTQITLKKKICKLLTGSSQIVVTNPNQTQGSAPLLCTERCPTN